MLAMRYGDPSEVVSGCITISLPGFFDRMISEKSGTFRDHGPAPRGLPPRPASYFSGGVANSFPVGMNSLV
jgi:hypothetical protein